MTWGDVRDTPPGGTAAAAATAPQSDRPALSLGVTLGAYRLVQRLGEGGMGVVHLGLDAHGRAVAIKVLRAHIAYDPDARARLGREVATLGRVRHPMVAEVLDADVDGDQPYVVTRYVPGPTLDAEVRERGPMPATHLVRLGRGLSSALEAIHAAGVVHRDLKPGNVLILDGDPVVIDFGIAHVADDVRLTMTGLVMGTPGYLPPELVEGSAVTAATDWWGWAATLAFAASGEPPFGRGPTDVVIDRVRRGTADLSGVDERLRPLLLAALSANPAARPSARDLLAALERYAAGGLATVPVPVVPPTRSLPGPTRAVDIPTTKPYAAPPYAAPPPPPPPVPADPPPADPLDLFRPPDPGAGPAQPPKPRRTGTLFAVLLGLVGVGSGYPTLTALAAVALLVLARTADRSVDAATRRRQLHGPRGTDGVVAAVSAPWHLLRGALASVPALILPVILGVSAAFCAGLAMGSSLPGDRSNQVAAAQVAAAVGLFVGLLVAWWGPGGASVRRGARGLTRGVARGTVGTSAVVALGLAGGAAAAYVAYVNGSPDFWPLHHLPLGITAP
jgi:serine/threonine protein kinase